MSESGILSVENLSVTFATERGVARAVRDVSVSVRAGETLAVVGESGSGKTVTARSILRLHDPATTAVSGRIFLDGDDLLALPEREMRRRARLGRLHDLPGPHDVAQSAHARRGTGGRGLPRAQGHAARAGPGRVSRALREGRDIRSGAAIRAVPSRVLRWHAAAGHDPHLRGRGAAAHGCRRAHDVARRDGAGADPPARRHAEGRSRDGGAAHHARHGHRGRARGEDRRHVRRTHRRVRADGGGYWRVPVTPIPKGSSTRYPARGPGGSRLRTIEGTPPGVFERMAPCPFAPRCRYQRPVCDREAPPLVDVGGGRSVACVRSAELDLKGAL